MKKTGQRNTHRNPSNIRNCEAKGCTGGSAVPEVPAAPTQITILESNDCTHNVRQQNCKNSKNHTECFILFHTNYLPHYFFLKIRIIPTTIAKTQNKSSIPKPFSVTADDALIFCIAAGCKIMIKPVSTRQIAPNKQRPMPSLLSARCCAVVSSAGASSASTDDTVPVINSSTVI